MTSMSQIFNFIILFGYVFAGEGDRKNDHAKIYRTQYPIANDGMMGVASVAGFTSQNGRISSAGGIHFFSPMNQHVPSPQNIEIFKKAEGNMATAIIKMYPESSKSDNVASFMNVYPGTLAVASTMTSQPNLRPRQPLWPNLFDSMAWPMNGAPATSNNALNNRRLENWLHNDVYNNFVPSPNYLKTMWQYPIFDPFFNYY